MKNIKDFMNPVYLNRPRMTTALGCSDMGIGYPIHSIQAVSGLQHI